MSYRLSSPCPDDETVRKFMCVVTYVCTRAKISLNRDSIKSGLYVCMLMFFLSIKTIVVELSASESKPIQRLVP